LVGVHHVGGDRIGGRRICGDQPGQRGQRGLDCLAFSGTEPGQAFAQELLARHDDPGQIGAGLVGRGHDHHPPVVFGRPAAYVTRAFEPAHDIGHRRLTDTLAGGERAHRLGTVVDQDGEDRALGEGDAEIR
jgi:hypothetical protein